MNCSVTLTAKEFETLHNSLYQLSLVNNEQVVEQVKVIRQALKGAYDQESEGFDRRYAHYDQVRKELDLTATWSIYEVENLSESHPFETAKTVSYKSYVTNKTIVKPIIGGTFAALYMAANACIRESLDEHHVFIERFEQNGDTLVLTTGS